MLVGAQLPCQVNESTTVCKDLGIPFYTGHDIFN